MQSWYLLYCKRGQLQRAQEHLERQAVNCLAPMITLEKIVRGNVLQSVSHCSPYYLFVEFDPEVIHTTVYHAHPRCQPLRALWRVASDSPIGGYSSAIGI
ncbi:transcription termination/antitermination NusG family protein [Enterobacter hormaechei]